ncbi:DUF3793 family protein [Lachnotalea glycerini]|jgi:hypothetical protein|uniref:DUF3793 family protein n=1 Tax=Lachnotalea glycerini TaxID=1763509 RepID=A0A371JFE7_9FIRM|nr:DUF3793 family protein [Lachnotalea glycerini]RDY31479.1 DUF3793 family protein [Lachnotalea glycerini]
MSSEVFQIIKSMNLKNLEIQLAIQCAPFIMGIKISNLLIVQRENAEYVEEMFKNGEISYFILCETQNKTTFLLYRLNELMGYLSKREVINLLAVLGYKNHMLFEILSCIRKKYEAYMATSKKFPHELGLILGYPVEDVYGFMANQGQNFLYAGYWKVYENIKEKQRMFEKYNQAKETAIRLVSSGESIWEIIDKYSNNNLQNAVI